MELLAAPEFFTFWVPPNVATCPLECAFEVSGFLSPVSQIAPRSAVSRDRVRPCVMMRTLEPGFFSPILAAPLPPPPPPPPLFCAEKFVEENPCTLPPLFTTARRSDAPE